MSTLLNRVLAYSNLTDAWRRVWQNDGGPGADGISIEQFGKNALAELASLKKEVLAGKYKPGLLREIELPRVGRSPRILGVPCVRDRVLQTATTRILAPIIDSTFAEESHAYRVGHSVAGAIAQVIEARNQGYIWVVDADISDYFDCVPHIAVLERLGSVLSDTSLHSLFAIWLNTPASVGLTIRKRANGLPQGAPISPLLANLYLDRFDIQIRNEMRRHVRYADDFLILCRDYDAAEVALEEADVNLRGDGLELNYSKTRITCFAEGFDFLGVRFHEEKQWPVIPEAGRWLIPKNFSPVPDLPPETPAYSTSTPPKGERFRPLLNTIHVTEKGAYIHKRGGRIVVERDDIELFEIPIEKIDQVCVNHEGAVSFGVLRDFLEKKISFVLTSGAGEPIGWLEDLTGGNVHLHRDQFMRAEDSTFCLNAACAFIGGKIKNSRQVLRRYFRFNQNPDLQADDELAQLGRRLTQADNLNVLRGIEGAAARRYFDAFGKLLGEGWRFQTRNRRPPRDPVNVLLSYGYAVLFQNVLTLVVRRGLHPHVGSLHTTTDRHPALVSDLMEEFRSLVVDAVVLKLLLNGRIKPEHFDFDNTDYPCRLKPTGKRVFIQALETKFDATLKHPTTGKSIDLRRAIASQAQHWADYVSGREKTYRAFTPR